MQQRRFSGTGLAGNKNMMSGALSELQMLPLGGPSPAEGNIDAVPAVGGPPLIWRGGDKLEGNLDPSCVARLLPGYLQDARYEIGVRRSIQLQRKLVEVRIFPGKSTALPHEVDADLFQIRQDKALG